MAEIIGKIVHKLSAFDLHLKYKEQILAQERYEEKIRLERGKDHEMTIN